jgi:phosphatidylglycerol---prolipoprotein diacylglyceryl transferase
MGFPLYLQLGSLRLHPHPLWESLAYFVSMRLALGRFKKLGASAEAEGSSGRTIQEQRGVIIAGGLLGGILGAKALAILQHLDFLLGGAGDWRLLLIGGKTIVGALLGATWGVEITKKIIGVTRSTGDAFAYPLLIGTAIGRVGCFLTGLEDQTYGVATHLPWAVDFGDGIPRHPTQLYEIVFLLGLLAFLKHRERRPMQPGDLFRFYSIGYLSFRWAIDFIKPDFHPILGMSAIQIACLLGLVYYRQACRRIL